MDLHDGKGTEARFRAYAADLASVLGHADRVRPFEDCYFGLLSAEGPQKRRTTCGRDGWPNLHSALGGFSA
jgi:SRSO17 transposase